MKILFLQDSFPPNNLGGAGKVAYELAKGIAQKGHEVFVITTTQKKGELKELEMDNLKIFQIYSNYHERWRSYLSLYNPQVVFKVEKIIKKIKPEIIHVHNIHYYLSYHCLKIAKKNCRLVFLTAHDAMLFHYGKFNEYINQNNISRVLSENNEQNLAVFQNYNFSSWQMIKRYKKRYNPFRNIIIRHYLKYVDKIFCISNSLKQALALAGITNTEVIYNGIDLRDWNISKEEIDDFKKKYNLINKKTLIFGGRLSAEKGGEIAIRVLSQVVKKEPNVILLVAGRLDNYGQKMMSLAKELNLSNNIIFTGWLELKEIKLALSASDICLTLSIYLDPFNLFNIEAMAAKKPVIGTCFGGTPEIVLNNITGYIINPFNISAAADKILYLLNNPLTAEHFGSAGYERVKNFFSLENQVEKILLFYKYK